MKIDDMGLTEEQKKSVSSTLNYKITLQCSLDELTTIIRKEGYSWFADKTLEAIKE